MKNIIQRDILLVGDEGGFENKSTIIYQALYNSCIHDSAYCVISLHRSEANAQKAIDDHKQGEYEKFLEYMEYCEKDDPEFFKKHPPVFAKHEDWTVSPIEVLD